MVGSINRKDHVSIIVFSYQSVAKVRRQRSKRTWSTKPSEKYDLQRGSVGSVATKV